MKIKPSLAIYQAGYSLLEITISLTIGLIILSALLHYIFIITKTYNGLQCKIDYQNAQLIANHYLATDIRNSGSASVCKAIKGGCIGIVTNSIEKLINTADIKPNSDVLILNSATGKTLYYIRNSIIPIQNHMHSYALYRDDLLHNSVAIVEGLINFQVDIQYVSANKLAVYLHIELKNSETMELIFVPRNHNQA